MKWLRSFWHSPNFTDFSTELVHRNPGIILLLEKTWQSLEKQVLTLPVFTHLSPTASLLIYGEIQQRMPEAKTVTLEHWGNLATEKAGGFRVWVPYWASHSDCFLLAESVALRDNLVKFQPSDLVSSLSRFHHRGPEYLCLHSKYVQSHPILSVLACSCCQYQDLRQKEVVCAVPSTLASLCPLQSGFHLHYPRICACWGHNWWPALLQFCRVSWFLVTSFLS